jgi:hypothetical protein
MVYVGRGRRFKLGSSHVWCIVFLTWPKYTQCAQDQYMRCRNLSEKDRSPDNAEITRSGVISSTLQDFYDSTCEVCPTRNTTAEQVLRISANRTRVVVLLTHPSTFQKMLIIAAGLLTSGSPVIITTGPNTPEHHLIRQVLFHHIPCEKHLTASILLTFKSFTMHSSQMCPSMADPSKRPGDVILCSIQNAERAAGALLDILAVVSQPGVLILDVMSFAGMLVAERKLLPTIMIVENAGVFLRHVFGKPQCSTGFLLSPRVWFNALPAWINDRLNSLDLSSSFVALNRARSRLQLARVRHMSDLWRVGGKVLLTSDLDAKGWQYALPNLRFISDPLLPPCVTCLAAPVSTDPTKPTVLVVVTFSNDDKGRASSRRLVHAFDLARTSIKQIAKNETCAKDDRLCWNGPTDFQVVRPGTMPEVLPPDFVIAEDTVFLDSLARHNPVAIVSTCDVSNSWTHGLGSLVLCIDEISSPREMAFHLLKLWLNQEKKPFVQFADTHKYRKARDDLEWVVSVAERMGLLHDGRSNTWQDGGDFGRYRRNHSEVKLLQDIDDNEISIETVSAIGALLVILAWLFLGCAAAYISLKDTPLLQKFQLRRLHYRNHHQLNLSVVINEILFRLPDLDHVLSLWREWMTELIRHWEETVASPCASVGNTEVTEHLSYSKRKRHMPKKRH